MLEKYSKLFSNLRTDKSRNRYLINFSGGSALVDASCGRSREKVLGNSAKVILAYTGERMRWKISSDHSWGILWDVINFDE